MTNEVNVRDDSGNEVIGKIVAEAGMPLKFHNFPDDYNLVTTAVSQDIVTATGLDSVEFKDYAFYANVTETNAETYGWPTGTNCRVFGHEGEIDLVQFP